MKPWILNISRIDAKKGSHKDPGPNSMLIQISDPPGDHPTPSYKFKEVHQFDFLDIEQDGLTNFGDGVMVDASEFAIKQKDADELVRLLKHALDNQMNVIVHCHAGICRSGAVVEVGTMLGFNDAGAFRSPNLLVKHLMMKSLGWTYDSSEPHSINGVPVDEDWTNDNEKVFTLARIRKELREKNGDYEGDI